MGSDLIATGSATAFGPPGGFTSPGSLVLVNTDATNPVYIGGPNVTATAPTSAVKSGSALIKAGQQVNLAKVGNTGQLYGLATGAAVVLSWYFATEVS